MKYYSSYDKKTFLMLLHEGLHLKAMRCFYNTAVLLCKKVREVQQEGSNSIDCFWYLCNSAWRLSYHFFNYYIAYKTLHQFFLSKWRYKRKTSSSLSSFLILNIFFIRTNVSFSFANFVARHLISVLSRYRNKTIIKRKLI